MSKRKKVLEWGETPWDDMTRDQLLREVQRMYAALLSANGVMVNCQMVEPDSLFWKLPNGRGAKAIAKADLALKDVAEKFDSENVYRAFFRPACDLLFTPALGFNWTVCDDCGEMVGGEELNFGECYRCKALGRKNVRRLLEWKDMEPKKVKV